MSPARHIYFNKTYIACFFILGLFPVVPFSAKPFLLGPLALVSIFRLFFKPLQNIDWKMALANTGIFIVFLYSMFYSDNSGQASKQIIRLLPFLVLPFSFTLVPPEIYEKAKQLFFRVFTIGCGLFCILVFVYAYWLQSDDIGYIYSYISWHLWGYREHPIYISLYLGIALIILLYFPKKTPLNIVLSVLILFTLFFLTRKGNLISLFLVGTIGVFLHKNEFFSRQSLRHLAVFGIVLAGAVIIFDNYIFTRFQEIFIAQEWYDTSTSTGIRNTVLKVCTDLSFERPFWGYGLGDVQDDINKRLIELGHENLTTIHQYNAHNQYMQTALSSGYIGLVLFLMILFVDIKKIITTKNKLALSVFLYIIFCFTFESLLERQNGAIVAAIFINLFIFSPKNENNHHQP